MKQFSFESYEKVPTETCRPTSAALRESHGGLEVCAIDNGDLQGMQLYFPVNWDQGGSPPLVHVPQVDCGEAIEALRREGTAFGLLLDCGGGLIAVRRQLAELGLQRIWQSAPVFLLAKEAPEPRREVLRAAKGWHVAAADIPGLCTAQMALRRLTWPSGLSCGGALPLRFWWHNGGDCPVYGHTRVRIVLRGLDGVETDVPLNDHADTRLPGDGVYNEIAQMPKLLPGEYQIACGIFRDDGTPLELAIDAPCERGFYTLGTLRLDDVPRPELYSLWDDYYPEGYYPLEDPKLPY